MEIMRNIKKNVEHNSVVQYKSIQSYQNTLKYKMINECHMRKKNTKSAVIWHR